MKKWPDVAVTSFVPKIKAAIAPPASEPTSPSETVSQAGIGSGPGRIQRAAAPIRKPDGERR